MCFQSQVGAIAPSTSAVPAPNASRGCGMRLVTACLMTGLSRSQRRLTVDRLTPKIAPANSCVTFVRIKPTTSMTDRYRPRTGGLPPGRATSASGFRHRTNNARRCPSLGPVRSSRSNGPSCDLSFAHEIQGRGPLFCLPLHINSQEICGVVDDLLRNTCYHGRRRRLLHKPPVLAVQVGTGHLLSLFSCSH